MFILIIVIRYLLIRQNLPKCHQCIYFVERVDKPNLCSKFLIVCPKGKVKFDYVAQARLDKYKCGIFAQHFIPSGDKDLSR